MPVEPAPDEAAVEIQNVLTALSGSGTLDLLGMTNDDLEAARTDSALFETLRITHDVLLRFRDDGVLGTFLLLPKHEQANFVRWIAATDEDGLRHARMETFITALKQSPLADSTEYGGAELGD